MQRKILNWFLALCAIFISLMVYIAAAPLNATSCSGSGFQCSDGTCLPPESLCNGASECSDNSDESMCELVQDEVETTFCKESDFRCSSDGICISEASHCDGQPDCLDKSDERNCTKNIICKGSEFQCLSSGLCIDSSYVCDGGNDCSDNSDEEGCPLIGTNMMMGELILELKSDENSTEEISPEEEGFILVSTRAELSNHTLIYEPVEEDLDLEDSTLSSILEEELVDAEIPRRFNQSVKSNITEETKLIEDFGYNISLPENTTFILNQNDSVITIVNLQNTSISTNTTVYEISLVDLEGVDLNITEIDISNKTLIENDVGDSNYTSVTYVKNITSTKALPKNTTITTAKNITSIKELPSISTITTTTLYTTSKNPCRFAEFFCKFDGICIPVEWRCDLTKDCWDGSDEDNCHKVICPSDMIQCQDTGQCIYHAWICDGQQDCDNGSDETHCY